MPDAVSTTTVATATTTTVPNDSLVTVAGHHYNGIELFGGLCLLIFTIVLLRAHFNSKSKIDLVDLLLDYQVPRDPRYKLWAPRITMRMWTGFCGFFMGAWAFLFSVLSGTLDKNWSGIAAFMTVCFTVQLGAEVVRGFVAPRLNGTATTATDIPEPPPVEPPPKP